MSPSEVASSGGEAVDDAFPPSGFVSGVEYRPPVVPTWPASNNATINAAVDMTTLRALNGSKRFRIPMHLHLSWTVNPEP
jgi:hypothetical protein